MKNKSIWNDVEINSSNEEMVGTLKTDVLIVGAGITGLSCAYFLKDKYKSIVIVDKENIGKGITNKTTGKVNYMQGDIYSKLEKYHGKDKSKLYYESQKEAINLIKDITKNYECDLYEEASILFTNQEKNIDKINREKELLEEFGESVQYIKDKRVLNAIKVDNGYSFHPIKFLKCIIESFNNNVSIYENTLVTSYIKHNNKFVVETDKGIIIAKKLVIACHYPFFIFPLLIPLKTHMKREYVCASKVKFDKRFNAINIDDTLHSIRFHEDYLIYTSNEHKLTNKLDYKKNYLKSRKDFKKYFKENPEYTWMNQDIMSNDYLPFIGRVEENLYIATAFNAWGMTNGVLSGKIISDLIIKGKNKYEKLFDPKRINLTLITNSFLKTFSYLKAYVTSSFINNPRYIEKDGIWYGVYKDKSGEYHKIKLLCPHMKCKLIFNYEEETWDCPCHGSRFDLDGNIIEGPSTKKLIDK